ncbi:MAG: sigma-70 family RNA polymerase sigma factor [Clostridia bacterium]|nr:sigma-70 family RNA polymerase sigma factor [Clostridia bacterium]
MHYDVDEKEYNRICDEHYALVYKYCKCRLRDSEDAKEAANDVMIMLFRKWHWLIKNDNIGAWLMKTARNIVKQKQRSIAKSLKISSLDEMEEKGIQIAASTLDLFSEIELENFDLERAINDVYEKTPDEYQEIFKLRFFEKRVITEVANIVGMPYSTLRLLLIDIEKSAREMIKKEYS